MASRANIRVRSSLNGTTNISIAWNVEGENKRQASGSWETNLGGVLVVQFGEVEVLTFAKFAGSFPSN